MITPRVNCSRVSVRRVSRALQKFQGCVSHSEAATSVPMNVHLEHFAGRALDLVDRLSVAPARRVARLEHRRAELCPLHQRDRHDGPLGGGRYGEGKGDGGEDADRSSERHAR